MRRQPIRLLWWLTGLAALWLLTLSLLTFCAMDAKAEWQLPETISKGLWPKRSIQAPTGAPPVVSQPIGPAEKNQSVITPAADDEYAPTTRQEVAPAPVVKQYIEVFTPEKALPITRPAIKHKPHVKSAFVKPKRKICDMTGPNLPWACWLVRMNSAGKTRAQLVAEGKARNIKLSCKQIMQAEACLTGAKP